MAETWGRRGAVVGEEVTIPTPGAPSVPRPGGLPTSALASLYAMQGPAELPVGVMAGQMAPPVDAAMIRRDPGMTTSIPPNLFPGREMAYVPPPALQAPPAAGRPVPGQQQTGAEMAGNLPQYTADVDGLFRGSLSPARRAVIDGAMTRGRAPASSSAAFAGQQRPVGLPQGNAQLPAMPQAAALNMGGQQAAPQAPVPVRREPPPVMVSPPSIFGPRR